MDYSEQLLELSDKEFALAKKYATERKAYGEKSSELGIILAAFLPQIQEKRKSIGKDMAMTTLISQKPELSDFWADTQKHRNNYKAIEKMIEAVRNKIYAIKEIMRYNRVNDGGM